MYPKTKLEELRDYLAHIPMRLAYRIVWFCAKYDIGSGRDIYSAMWDANLALPEWKSKNSS